MIPVETQFYTFGVTILLGVLMGIFFDFYRETRRKVRLKKLGTDIFDLMVWIFFTCLAFGTLLYVNNGEVRGFTFLGIFLGLLVYFSLLSRSAVKGIRLAVRAGFGFFSFLWKLIRVPMVIFYKMLYYPANFISLLILKALIPVTNMLKKLRSLIRR